MKLLLIDTCGAGGSVAVSDDTRVLAWTDTEYTYLKRQSERSSGAWVAVDDTRTAVAVGSVR